MNIDELRADLLRPKLKPAVGSAKPTVVTTLVGALETHDSGGLSTVLTAIPKDKLKKALTDSKILTALVDNYNPNAHTQLVKKGFDLCFFSEKILFTCIHGPGWSNLLSNTPKTKAFDKWLHHMFQETLDYDFQKRYPMCKNNAAEFRRALQQYDPVLHDQALKVFFKNSEGVHGHQQVFGLHIGYREGVLYHRNSEDKRHSSTQSKEHCGDPNNNVDHLIVFFFAVRAYLFRFHNKSFFTSVSHSLFSSTVEFKRPYDLYLFKTVF